jgi:hypothetical protein
MLNESFGVYDIAEILPNSKIYNFMHFNSIILGILHKQWIKKFIVGYGLKIEYCWSMMGDVHSKKFDNKVKHKYFFKI